SVRRLETPPQAWGRLRIASSALCKRRNTPTGVRKTASTCSVSRAFWKHPHRRGEDDHHSPLTDNGPETPPQAWGRPWPGTAALTLFKKHPHRRGEDFQGQQQIGKTAETPPQAWGRLF